VVLCVNRIPPEQKTRFPEVLCVFLNTAKQKSDRLLSGKFISPWKWHSGEDLLRSFITMLEQIALRDILLLEEIQGKSPP
jgi:hypothetical protein